MGNCNFTNPPFRRLLHLPHAILFLNVSQTSGGTGDCRGRLTNIAILVCKSKRLPFAEQIHWIQPNVNCSLAHKTTYYGNVKHIENDL